MRREPFVIGFILLAAAFLTLGCAPQMPKQASAANRLELLKGASLSDGNANSDPNWDCPTDVEYNVVLQDGIGLTGPDNAGGEKYTVCTYHDDTSRFKISGDASSRSICIYPMLKDYSGNPTLVDAPQCFGISDAPIDVKFNAQNANYMVIVDSDFTDAMNSCLSSSAPCPPHAEGFVQ